MRFLHSAAAQASLRDVPGAPDVDGDAAALCRLDGSRLAAGDQRGCCACSALTLPAACRVTHRLVDLKNIYAKQLPNMPKDYIVRLVFDRGHKSLIALKARARTPRTDAPTRRCSCARADVARPAAQSDVIVGGITYRLFGRQALGEIAFCAVSAAEQVKGYGTRLMDKLKGYVTREEGLTHLITFADNNAVGYFQKQARLTG